VRLFYLGSGSVLSYLL